MFSYTQIVAIVAIFASIHISLQTGTPHNDDPFYSAGVVEFRPSAHPNSENRMMDNLLGYLTILQSDAAKNLDIIVFPESTLNNNEHATLVPNPATASIVPCDDESQDYHSLLVQLSCAAKRLLVYLLINLTEKEWCSTVPEDTRPCSNSSLNLYNTNVVFDRSGAVISRYRKVHLYGENVNTTFKPEMGWFDTDFGVRFGHFICFDILFYAPAQALVVENGIKDFIFPSMWFSQLPFLTAVQFHQAWSYANDVNFLAAGASNPSVGSTGTGIYHGRHGIVVAKMNGGLGERQLYVAQVPKYRRLTKRSSFAEPSFYTKRNERSVTNITFKRDNLENYKTVPLNLTTSTSLEYEMCSNRVPFCCRFKVEWRPLGLKAQSKHYHYRLGFYEGWRSEVTSESNHLKNCALFSCTGEDITDCGKVLDDIDTDVIFENITINATFPNAENLLIMPNSLNASIMPLPVNHFQWVETYYRNTIEVLYELKSPTSNIMAFSTYANYYDYILVIIAEPDDPESNTAASLAHSLIAIMGIYLFKLML